MSKLVASEMMDAKQPVIIGIGLFFAGLVLFAWVAKPPTLKQKLERSGVHFAEDGKSYPEYNHSTGRLAFDIRQGEIRPLITTLMTEGFHENPEAKMNDGSMYHNLSRGTAQLFFNTGQHLTIVDGKKTTVFFDFPIN